MPNPFWNRQQFRLRTLWRLILQLILMLILVVVLSILIGVITVAVGMATHQVSSLTAASVSNLLTNPVAAAFLQFASSASMILSVWLAGVFLDQRNVFDFGFHFNRGWWIDFAFGLCLGAALMALIFVLELAAGWVSFSGAFASAPGEAFVPGILVALVTFILVGIGEEMLFRGYQLHNLAEGLQLPKISPRAALLLAYFLASFVFGLFHLGNPNTSLISTINLCIAGLFLGLGFILTGELAIPIGLHIAWNFFQGNVFGFPVSGTQAGSTFIAIHQGGPEFITGGAFGPEAGLVGLLAIALGCAAICAWVKYRTGKLTLAENLAVYPGDISKSTGE